MSWVPVAPPPHGNGPPGDASPPPPRWLWGGFVLCCGVWESRGQEIPPPTPCGCGVGVCCAVLCYAMLCCAVLCYAVLCCAQCALLCMCACAHGHITCFSLFFLAFPWFSLVFLDFAACWPPGLGYHTMGGGGARGLGPRTCICVLNQKGVVLMPH